jgi:flagellum-specific peptidoglycan hydrolase FlgJ
MPAPSAFAGSIASDVVRNCINTGIFPSVVIAQAIQESGSGTSALATRFNNLFGHIASLSWGGKVGQTKKGGRKWRWYDSIAQCVQAHVGILRRPAYKLAGVVSAASPFEQALALQHGGYDTGADRGQYAQKLGHIIRSLNLQSYDKQLFSIERRMNKNGLAFHEQGGLTKALHTIIG